MDSRRIAICTFAATSRAYLSSDAQRAVSGPEPFRFPFSFRLGRFSADHAQCQIMSNGNHVWRRSQFDFTRQSLASWFPNTSTAERDYGTRWEYILAFLTERLSLSGLIFARSISSELSYANFPSLWRYWPLGNYLVAIAVVLFPNVVAQPHRI
jgi:hypothetical protein